MHWLKGKKTYLISLGLAVLAVIFRLDVLLHDLPETEMIETAWLTLATYATIGAMLGAGDASAMRMGIKKP